MSAYFRMSDEILDCECACELAQNTVGDHYNSVRMLLFIRILCAALYPSKQFTDADALSRFSGVSVAQARRVWATCLKHRVLRKSGYGYNAHEWLVENGFLGKYTKDADKAYREGVHGC